MKFTLEQARKYSGLSQAQIADKIGIPMPSYYNYEHGKSVMRVDVADRFADVVGIPFEQIIFYSKSTEKM